MSEGRVEGSLRLTDLDLSDFKMENGREIFDSDEKVRCFEKYLQEKTEKIFKQYQEAHMKALVLSKYRIIGV